MRESLLAGWSGRRSSSRRSGLSRRSGTKSSGASRSRGDSVATFRAFAHAHAANVFDLPAACVPAGRTAAGLPVGVQIVGRPHEEWRVLAAARLIEEALGGWQPPPEPLSNGRGYPL